MGMRHFLQFADGWVAYGLGWGIGVDDLCLPFQTFQLFVQQVLLRIGDYRCVPVIVGVTVFVKVVYKQFYFFYMVHDWMLLSWDSHKLLSAF